MTKESSGKTISARAFYGELILSRMLNVLDLKNMSQLERVANWPRGIASHIRAGRMKMSSDRLRQFLDSPACKKRGITISRICKSVYYLTSGNIVVSSRRREELWNSISAYLSPEISESELKIQFKYFFDSGIIPAIWIEVIESAPLDKAVKIMLREFSILSVDTDKAFTKAKKRCRSNEECYDSDDSREEKESENGILSGVFSKFLGCAVFAVMSSKERNVQEANFISEAAKRGFRLEYMSNNKATFVFSGESYEVDFEEIFTIKQQ